MTKEEITKSQFYAGDNWGRKLKQELAAVQEPLLGKRIVKVEITPGFEDQPFTVGKYPRLTITVEDGTKLYFNLPQEHEFGIKIP
ncbi:hypothetical protein IH779_01305 [Patescibacteria group bacterium]|nr:hypothetical protein [Patescibacteria group bacterium]